jgi:ATP-dependent DNA helicase RecG
MNPKTNLKELKGVGEVVEKRLVSMGLKTVNDLIGYFPRRYDDYSHITSIKDIRPGLVTIKASFTDVRERRAKRGLSVTEADARDNTGAVRIVWFNQPYRATF